MSQRWQSTFEMSTATPYSADSSHDMQPGKTGRSEESLALLVEPFDSVEDDGCLPASRAYPKVLDISSPNGSPTVKNAHSEGPEKNDKDIRRPWPKPEKTQHSCKRKRETNDPDPPELPAHQQDGSPLQRWLHEPPAQEPYHGIADAGEDPCLVQSAKGNNMKKHGGELD